MFKLAVVIATACVLVSVTGCAARKAPSPDAGTETVTYEVFGMDCPGCHGGLEKNLRKIPGVVDAAANWKEQRVTIYIREGETVATGEIEAAIEESNFTMGRRLD